MAQTLEQERASFAWTAAQRGIQASGEKYVNLAKSTPTLIMSSGLMQTLAFLKSKEKERAHQQLCDDLGAWLAKAARLGVVSGEFKPLMQAIQKADPRTYREATMEALALLKWLRQFAPALHADGSEV